MNTNRATIKETNGCRVRVVHFERVDRARDEASPEQELNRLALTFKVTVQT